MRISDAARELGVASHVLRHWEDMGVVIPARTAAGHRSYDDESVERLRIVIACQRSGLTLKEIAQVLQRGAAGRGEAITRRLAVIEQQRRELAEAESFLTHVLDCHETLMSRCPECSAYARSTPGRGVSASPRRP